MKAETLALRLDVLERGIGDVQTVLEASKEIPAALRNARSSAEDATWFVGVVDGLANENVISALNELKLFLEGLEDNDAVIDVLDRQRIRIKPTWGQALATLGKELGSRDDRAQLTKRLTKLSDELARIDDRVVRFDEGFGERIGQRIGRVTAEIGALRERLERDEHPPDLWVSYFEKIEPEAQRVFAEYVDLLGGVSIRERALAMKALSDVCHLDELCRLADSHLEKELTLCLARELAASFVAVPGLNLVGDVPPWPILRLGFALWSIWGLPLAGHEFGKTVADVRLSEPGADAVWSKEIEQFGEPGLRTLIADTVAAWAEGPAYAAALLYLVLRPGRVEAGATSAGVTDAERATLVLDVLDRQAGPPTEGGERREDQGYFYLDFLEDLRKDWRNAAPAADAGDVRSQALAALPELVVRRLDLRKPFTLTDWKHSKTVLDHLLKERPEDRRVPDELALGVRHVTTAAWRGRLSHDQPAADPVELEERALREGVWLISPQEEQTRSGATDAAATALRSRRAQRRR